MPVCLGITALSRCEQTSVYFFNHISFQISPQTQQQSCPSWALFTFPCVHFYFTLQLFHCMPLFILFLISGTHWIV